MPEGPEIHLQAHAIAKAITGKVVDVYCAHENVTPYFDLLHQKRVDRVYARGKAVLIQFESGYTLYAHNQLYGRWIVHHIDSPPLTSRSLRVCLTHGQEQVRLYSASDVCVLVRGDEEEHPYIERLGPDACDLSVNEGDLLARFEEKKFAGKRLANLLLDQAFVAGIGNYLRSEIAFVCGVRLSLKLKELSAQEKQILAWALLELPRRSFESKGITNEPELYRALRATRWSRSKARHFVFAREDEACFVCGETIERFEIAARRAYQCHACQRGD